MSTPNIIQNLGQGDMPNVNRGMNNLGKPVLNNSGPSGVASPIVKTGGGLGTVPVPGQPLQPITQPGGTITTPPGMQDTLNHIIASNGGMAPQQAGGQLLNPPGVVPTSTGTPTNPPLGTQTPAQAGQLSKQLVDIYGKGEGNLLDSLINSIGGNDDAYLDAYKQAMAGPNAENLATLNTTLGNSGIGMNSSTAAIANADFQSNITAQEGYQAQQLKMNDLQQLMSLVQGLQGDSAKEVASGGWGSVIGGILGAIPGLSSLKSIFQGGSNGAGAIPTLDTTGGSDPLGLNSGSESAPNMGQLPSGSFGGDSLPSLDPSSFATIASSVFI